MKKFFAFVMGVLALGLAACAQDAQVVSENLSRAADNFEVNRRIVFVNTWTGNYELTIEGLCSLGSGSHTNSVTVTCKTGPNDYKKHFLGLGTNLAWFAEQLAPNRTSASFYRVTFKPSVIIPDIDVR